MRKPTYEEQAFLNMEKAKYGGRRGVTVRRLSPKIGRNDKCPCGSGVKFKKCCGETIQSRKTEVL